MSDVPVAVVESKANMALPALVGRLVDDAKDVARAEIAVYKAKAAERATAYKGAIIFFAIAGVLALATLGALLVGLILTLATIVGPGFATLIVTVSMLAIVGVLALVGKSRLASPIGSGT